MKGNKEIVKDYYILRRVLTILSFFIALLREKLGITTNTTTPAPWDDILKDIPLAILISLLVFIMITFLKDHFISQIYEVNSFICEKCNKRYKHFSEKCDECNGVIVFDFEENDEKDKE